MKTLAFDLSSGLIGWAFGNPMHRALPEVGLIRLPATREDIGACALHFRSRAVDLIDRLDPDIVAFESPFLPQPRLDPKTRKWGLNTNINTLRKLYTIAGVLELICSDRKLRCAEEHIPTIKKALTGTGRADKAMMVKAAEDMGIRWPRGARPMDREHMADAVGVWVCVAQAVTSGDAAMWTPLWITDLKREIAAHEADTETVDHADGFDEADTLWNQIQSLVAEVREDTSEIEAGAVHLKGQRRVTPRSSLTELREAVRELEAERAAA